MANKSLLLFLIAICLTLSSFVAHKFYVSVTQVDYNEEEKSLQIISRIFIDDIEEVLQERYDNSLLLNSNEETDKVDQYLGQYFKQKLKFTVNGKEVSFIFLGKEYEDDLVISYLEIENINSLDTIEISNEILMDLFEEQQNIVHVKKEDQRKSLILEDGRSTGVLKFSK